MLKLNDAEMWEAVKTDNKHYDGMFYYGVKTTGIFCRPSCKSRLPNRENVCFFMSLQEALNAGLRPCKRCRPDMLRLFEDPGQEICNKVTTVLEKEYDNPEILAELPQRIGVSPFHLQRTYKKLMGKTPKAYLQSLRIKAAGMLLESGGLSNTEICYRIGFSSLSSFYAAFRAETGISPRQYRLEACSKKEEVHEFCI